MKEQLLTAEEARAVLSYEPETGILRWKPNSNRLPRWNKKHAGKPAGSMNRRYIIVRYGHLYPAHRLAWLITYGEWPKNEIDHINGVPSDNRLVNLREATHAENSRNRGIRKNNRSGFLGIRYRPHHKKWEARIVRDGKLQWRGYFQTAQEASAARCAKLGEIHGEFARRA